MIKKGFTLQELLITLGIVGIISAITVPAIMSLRPDKNKSLFIKTYNTIATLTSEILNDTSLYLETYDADGKPNCVGMGCNAKPSDPQFNNANYEGTSKFAYLLANKLNVDGGITSGDTSNVIQFTTTDSIIWQVETSCENNDDGQLECSCPNIQVDVNPNSNDCHNVYSANCTNPTKFNLTLDSNGKLKADDAMSIAYLQNPTDLHAKDKDRKLAETLLAAGSTSDEMYKALEKINKDKKTKKTS